ncbi:MAG: type II secretion system protein J [Bacillota bacterium]
MTRHPRRLESAFTLLEVVIVIALFTIMSFAVIRFFISYNTSYLFERAITSSSSSAGTLMSEIRSAVLPADQVLTSHSFGGTTYSSATSTLVLELPSIDSAGVVISGTYDYIAFYTDGARVYEIIDANAASNRTSRTRLLSDSLNALTFSYDNASFPSVTTITADITTQAGYAGRTTQSHLREQVYLRNLPGS